MVRKITVSISGSKHDTDAPTVDDLLGQLKDYFDLLDLMERIIAEDGKSAIDWRIVHASTSSPIIFTAEAFSKQFSVNVDQRASLVAKVTTSGLSQLVDDQHSDRPKYFTDPALQRVEKIFERVTNGLKTTVITADDASGGITLTPSIARDSMHNVRTILAPNFQPYEETGSVEGYFRSVSLDSHDRRILNIKSRITGDDIKCIITDDAHKELEHCDIGSVWRKRRISVFGLIHYEGPLRISQIEATDIRLFQSRNELPSINDIIDPDFTGGLRSEYYLERLRDGKLS